MVLVRLHGKRVQWRWPSLMEVLALARAERIQQFLAQVRGVDSAVAVAVHVTAAEVQADIRAEVQEVAVEEVMSQAHLLRLLH
jgi:hypothetical protein